jgi:CheY-like chemotaxis protein
MHSLWNADLVSEFRVIDSPLDLLVAEDDPDDMILLRRTCRRLSWVRTLALVSDGQDVLDHLDGQGQYSPGGNLLLPDVLILDQRMPKLSGLEVLLWIRTHPLFSGLPVVLISTELLPEDKKILTTLKGAYCEKTIALSEMAAALHESVVQARSLVQSFCGQHSERTFREATVRA